MIRERLNLEIEQQIIEGTKKAGKSYNFNESHNPSEIADYWFQDSNEGLTLFVIFFTQACRWSRCVGCSLPSKMSLHYVDFKSIMKQIDGLFEIPDVKNKKQEIKKVIISNNGSVLDELTFPSTALIYLLAKLNINLLNLSVLSIETRPEFVDIEEIEFIQRALFEGNTPTKIELCIGFEAFNDKIRNEFFDKGLTLDTFENFIKIISKYNYNIKCYFMQKPTPNMNDHEAVLDIQNAIDYLSDINEKYNTNINIHLNPTFVAKGTVLEKAFNNGRYSPPKLIDVAKAVLHAKDKNISFFIGLSDERLSVTGGSFMRKGEENIVEKLNMFNKTNNYSIIEELLLLQD